MEIPLYSMSQTRSSSWINATLVLRRRYPATEILDSHERELTKSCKYEFSIRFRKYVCIMHVVSHCRPFKATYY